MLIEAIFHVSIFREIMILVFQHKTLPVDIYAFSALLLALTILRVGSIFMYQRELKMSSPAKVKEGSE